MKNWLRKLFGLHQKPKARKQANRPPRYRPRIEVLEGRCVPANIYWDGGGDGTSYGDALNWDADVVPGIPDRAIIQTGGFTVVGGNAAVGSLHCNASLDWTGFLSLVAGPDSEINGYFTLHDGDVTIFGQDLSLRGGGNLQGTFSPAADALLRFGTGGTFLLQAGTALGGAGYTHLAGSTLDLLGDVVAGNFHMSAGYLQGAGKFTVGNLNWAGGTMRGLGVTEVPAAGTMHLGDGPSGTGGPSAYLDQRTFNNFSSQAFWSGATDLYFSNAAAFNNKPGAIFEVQNHEAFDDLTPGCAFNNDGTFRKTAAGGTTVIQVAFNNDALSDLQQGTVNLEGGGVSTGEYRTAAAAETVFAFGTFAYEAGTVFTGLGFATIAGATGQVNADVTAEKFRLRTGGTLEGLQVHTTTKEFEWWGGTMRAGGTTRISPTGTLYIESNATKTLDERLLLLDGGALWREGNIHVKNGAKVRNQGSELFVITGVVSMINVDNSSARFENFAGQVDVNLFFPTSKATFDIDFDNGNASASGFVKVIRGSAEFKRNLRQFDGFITVSEEETSVTAKNFEFIMGNLDGPGMITITDSFVWKSGMMLHAEGLTNLLGTSSFVTPQIKRIVDRKLFNNGDVQWTDGEIQAWGQAKITNENLFEVHCDKPIEANGIDAHFYNRGTFRKSAGSGETVIEIGFDNRSAGGGFPGTSLVDVRVGRLKFLGEGTHDGSFELTGDVEYVGGEENVFEQGASFIGTGWLIVRDLSRFTVVIGAHVPAENFDLREDAVLSGGGTFSVGRRFYWREARMEGIGMVKGATVVEEACIADFFVPFPGGGANKLEWRDIYNYGTIRWLDGDIDVKGGSVIDNRKAFDILCNRNINNSDGSDSWFLNKHTLRKISGDGTATIGIKYKNTGTEDLKRGTLKFAGEVKEMGTTILDGGNLASVQDLHFEINTLVSGYGTITANVIMDGKIEVGGKGTIGAITIVGDYAQTGTGIVIIELAGFAAGSYDKLNVTGNATLAGELQVWPINDFLPGPNDVFDVVTYASHVGEFDSYIGPGSAPLYLATTVLVGPPL